MATTTSLLVALAKPLPKPLAVLAPEVVAGEAVVADIVINGIL